MKIYTRYLLFCFIFSKLTYASELELEQKLERQNAFRIESAPKFKKSSRKTERTDSSSSLEDQDQPVRKGHRTEQSSLSHQFFSSMKKKIAPYIPQVFKILVYNNFGGHEGTGFMFDAVNGIIATNLHVATPDYVKYRIKTHNGDTLKEEDIEILGLTPACTFGDFAFLRIKKLAGKFEQMPMVSDHLVKKHDPVAFMGNSLGHFSVEEGNLNGLYDFELDKTVHSIQVQLVSHGGASGSPTFNREGLINGILFGGDSAHTLICPIWHLQRAYAQITAIPGKISPVVVKTLGSLFDKISLTEVEEYRKIEGNVLKGYLPEDQLEEQNFITFCNKHVLVGSDSIFPNDILLTVEGQNIGCDTIKIAKIIENLETVNLRVIRGLVIKDIKVRPLVSTQTFSKRLNADNQSFIEITPDFFRYQFPLGKIGMISSATSIHDIGEGDDDLDDHLVNGLGGIPINTFDDLAKAFYKLHVKNGDNHMIIDHINEKGEFSGTSHLDLTSLGGTNSIVVQEFNYETRHWTKVALKKYIKGLKKK